MSDVMSPASTDQALEMLMVALGYLAAADATEMTAEEQARCLKVLERATAIGAAARTSALSAFTSGKGYSADADRKSTRLNSSHPSSSYAVFCLKKKINTVSVDHIT